MSLSKKTLAIIVAYLATVAVLIPLIFSVIYLFANVSPTGAPRMIIYIALGLCTLTGVGLLRWFRIQIEKRLQ